MSKFGFELDMSDAHPSYAWVVGNEEIRVPLTEENTVPHSRKLLSLLVPLIAHNAATELTDVYSESDDEFRFIAAVLMLTDHIATPQLFHKHFHQQAGFIQADLGSSLGSTGEYVGMRSAVWPMLGTAVEKTHGLARAYGTQLGQSEGALPYDYATSLRLLGDMLNWEMVSPSLFNVVIEDGNLEVEAEHGWGNRYTAW